ncbi:DUF861 domain-containing protein [Arthrobacter bambusae]|uniref:cupin domain-containing protein n=1 Tax=Arthrobacter bambusae TaxID=1338426 RepID=UPI001F50E581|nr:cupin domain-containing protein [Arthrobacter bambusae]MCI0144190.1 DUF861 domain-containing protein [Arthrobacter bambusae]
MDPVIEGAEFARERIVSDDAAGLCAVWAAQPGVYPRVKHQRGSAMYIFSGDATVYDKDGTPHEIHEGSILVLPYRWEGRWEIHRTIRKVYIHSWPTGEPPSVPALGVSLSGIEASQDSLAEPLPVSVHRGGFPDALARVITDGVDGLCVIAKLGVGSHPVSDGTRAMNAYLLEGEASLDGPTGQQVELRTGSVAVVPAGWAGTWNVKRPLRAFLFFTQPREEWPA